MSANNLATMIDAALARWEAEGRIKPKKRKKAKPSAKLLAEAARDMKADMYGEGGNG